MGEVMNTADYDSRVSGWEVGLPSDDELMPLSQALIPPQLAMAFNIKPEPNRTSIDVDRAARETFASLRRGLQPTFAENSFKPFSETTGNNSRDLMIIVDVDEDDDERSDSRKIRRIEGMEEADSVSRGDNSNSMALKRPRLVWTPQLHRRFVDVVSHLGIKSAVPKTIMQMMNVEGLTRENVASHLQKYRLYLKRGNDSSSDQLFASTPVPQNLNLHDGSRNGQRNMSIPTPYGSGMVPVPMFGMRYGSHGMDHHIQHGYGMMQQMDWSGNSNGSVVSYPHAPHAGN